jgi:hypothetical protein
MKDARIQRYHYQIAAGTERRERGEGDGESVQNSVVETEASRAAKGGLAEVRFENTVAVCNLRVEKAGDRYDVPPGVGTALMSEAGIQNRTLTRYSQLVARDELDVLPVIGVITLDAQDPHNLLDDLDVSRHRAPVNFHRGQRMKGSFVDVDSIGTRGLRRVHVLLPFLETLSAMQNNGAQNSVDHVFDEKRSLCGIESDVVYGEWPGSEDGLVELGCE